MQTDLLKHLFAVWLSACVVLSACERRPAKYQSNHNQASELDNSTVIWIEGFESKAKNLSDAMFKEFESGSQLEDSVITGFLADYSILAFQINSNEEWKQNPKTISRLDQSEYFSIYHHDSAPVAIEDFQLIKADMLAASDPTTRNFLNLYWDEFDNICCKGETIVISDKELIRRAHLWGELAGTAYKAEAYSNYMSYLSRIFLGLKNSPVFNNETGTFDMELYSQISEFTKDHPDAYITQDFLKILSLLESEDYKKTDKFEIFMGRLIGPG